MADPEVEVGGEENEGPIEIESLCVNCEENGTTRMLLTNIPCFKDIILVAFDCPHCGYRNQTLQRQVTCEEFGVRYKIKITNAPDLNRTIVKADNATVCFPDIDLEIPPETQQSKLTTVEGILTEARDSLMELQQTSTQDPEAVLRIAKTIGGIGELLTLEKPFVITLDDPSGNSFIENPNAPDPDPCGTVQHYQRTPEQDAVVGFEHQEDRGIIEKSAAVPPAHAETNNEDDGDQGTPDKIGTDEVLSIPVQCSLCKLPGENRMKVIDIPYFREVVLMSFNCEHCGFRSSEVKPSGKICETGVRIVLNVLDEDDMNRDILKSDTATIEAPELGLEILAGTLGGTFTTVEGLFRQALDHLVSGDPLSRGDSVDDSRRKRWANFKTKMEAAIAGDMKFTLVIDDPLGNSYLQNPYAPDEDPEMTITHYARTAQQNEDYGLADPTADATDHTTTIQEEEPEDAGDGE